jgi:RNA-directed DNA polymerase
MKIYKELFSKIISLENLFMAWDEFKQDKNNKADVREFEWNLENNIFNLHRELAAKTYRHGHYTSFFIVDPKQRNINKACVRDRILHHAIFSVLNPIFEPTFISTSYSCRVNKGTHKGVMDLGKALNEVGGNGYKKCFALKCDVKKFFDSVDHNILKQIIAKRIKDVDAMCLIQKIIDSFSTNKDDSNIKKGIPIGNLTSQLFANLYMNELDQYAKQELKLKHYFRYTDDFVVVSDNREYLKVVTKKMETFLNTTLRLHLHPNKVFIRKFSRGIDFLGYIVKPHHMLLRTKTKKRMFNKIKIKAQKCSQGLISKDDVNQTLQSYLGVLSHANSYGLKQKLINDCWLWTKE